ncbi:MAG TPA: nuclear transport factor 2 family protein [bacterium]|nr:nuclear transport factor 2 family protein [bacterium]
MTPAFATDVQREVWDALQRLNAAWLHGELDNLSELLHERMVIVPPGFQQRIEGAVACAEGYQEFARLATVESYEESDATVEVFGATAIVSYLYQLTYTMEGASYQDSGHDLYVFVHEDGRWQAVWRTLVPLLSDTAALSRR